MKLPLLMFVSSIFMLIMVDSWCATSQRAIISRPTPAQPADETIIRYLRATLSSGRKEVRIYYRGECTTDSLVRISFPVMETKPPADAPTEVEAIRSLFIRDPHVMVSETEGDIIRIKIGAVSEALLTTNVASVALSQEAQYNPNGPGGAIDVLERSPKLKVKMANLNIQQILPAYYICNKPSATSQYSTSWAIYWR